VGKAAHDQHQLPNVLLLHFMICHSKSAIDPAPQDVIKMPHMALSNAGSVTTAQAQQQMNDTFSLVHIAFGLPCWQYRPATLSPVCFSDIA
jgi:hypothetical protein